jgi:SAM-dependent methyltransferase
MRKYKFVKYARMQRTLYKKGTSDHIEHNDNPDYWSILLGDVSNDFSGKLALDFGCGKGRNIRNLLTLAKFKAIDGSDLSEANIKFCRNTFDEFNHKFFLTNGMDTGYTTSNHYDLVISTITFQHIPVYEIRKSILVDILRILKPGGLFSFQMGFGPDLKDELGRPRSGYFENSVDARSTNGNHDVRVRNTEELVEDLIRIGFRNVRTTIRKSFSDAGHPSWIYVTCFK